MPVKIGLLLFLCKLIKYFIIKTLYVKIFYATEINY